MRTISKLLVQIVALHFMAAIMWVNAESQKKPKQEIKEQSYQESMKLLELKLTTLQEKWRKGESVAIKIHTTNKGKTTARIPYTVPWYNYQISVLRESGQQVPKTPALEKQLRWKAISFNAQEIKPGETVEEKILISDLFDFTQKGTYKIVFKKLFYDDRKVQHELVSNTITLSVVE